MFASANAKLQRGASWDSSPQRKWVTFMSPRHRISWGGSQTHAYDSPGHCLRYDKSQILQHHGRWSPYQMHNKEQLAFYVRFVDGENNIREEFLNFSRLTKKSVGNMWSRKYNVPCRTLAFQSRTCEGKNTMMPPTSHQIGLQCPYPRACSTGDICPLQWACPESGHQPLVCPPWSTQRYGQSSRFAACLF